MTKGFIIAAAAGVVLGVTGLATIQGFTGAAASAADTINGAEAMAAEFSPEGVANSASEKLRLTQEQRARIREIARAEKPHVGPSVRELGMTFRHVQALTSTGSADDSAIRAAIDKEQPAVTTLIVEAARTKARIYNDVLTPSQREQASGMMASMDGRLSKRLDGLPSAAGRLVTMASWKLNLTDAQQAQIRSLVDAGVKHDLPLVKQLAAERRAIQAETANGNFDETRIAKLAEAPAKTATELAGDAAVLKCQVFAVLTPEQRRQVVKLQGRMRTHHAARMHRFFPRFGGTDGMEG